MGAASAAEALRTIASARPSFAALHRTSSDERTGLPSSNSTRTQVVFAMRFSFLMLEQLVTLQEVGNLLCCIAVIFNYLSCRASLYCTYRQYTFACSSLTHKRWINIQI